MMVSSPRPPWGADTRVVGVLCGSTGDPYSALALHGVTQTLSNGGVHTLCFAGGFPHAPLYGDLEHGPTALSTLDGLVILAGTVRGAEQATQHLVRSQRAVVSFGVELTDVPSVGVNDDIGVIRAVGHLAKRHGAKRIAFIAGPEDSVDGERRLATYRLALQNFHLAYDPALVVRGDYEAQSGKEATMQLLRYDKRVFDSIVAANDLMAIGALDALRAAGLRVPADVPVIGFDDMEEASFTSPSLTTVRQPVAEQGVMVGRLMLDRLAGRELELSPSWVATPLVIRRSCGCEPEQHSPRPFLLKSSDGVSDQDLVEDALRSRVGRHLSAARRRRELVRMAPAILGANGLPELASVLTEAFRLIDAKRLLVCQYDADPRKVRVLFESSGREVLLRETKAPAFPCAQLLPFGFVRPREPGPYVVVPLHLGREHFGYAVLDAPIWDGPHVELCHYLTAALGRIAREHELRRLYATTKQLRDGLRESDSPRR